MLQLTACNCLKDITVKRASIKVYQVQGPRDGQNVYGRDVQKGLKLIFLTKHKCRKETLVHPQRSRNSTL